MNHRFLLYTAAAALLLTGCAGSGPDTQEETAPQTTAQTGSEPENMASETQENAVSETQTTFTAESSTEPALTESVPAVTAPPMSIVIRQATAVTYTTAVTTQKTAAASQSEKPNIQSRYMMNPEPYYKAGKEVSLAGKGTVFSEDGLNLRTKPSESSEVIAAFPKHTQVEVLGAVFSGDCSLAQNRWYHVKVNGK